MKKIVKKAVSSMKKCISETKFNVNWMYNNAIAYFKKELGKHITIVIIIGLVLVTVGVLETLFDLNTDKDMIRYMFSAGAQVIATVFSISLATITFFYQSLSEKTSHDDTLEEIVVEIKNEVFNKLITISIYFILGIVLSLINIYIGNINLPTLFLSILIFFGVMVNLIVVILIVLMMIDVINPNIIASIVNKYKNDVSQEKASLEDFLKTYNYVETTLINKVESMIGENRFDRKDILYRFKGHVRDILGPFAELFYDIKKVRNFNVHSEQPFVTKKDVEALEKIKNELDKRIKPIAK